MKYFFSLLFCLIFSSCMVMDGVYHDPIYREQVIIYDVWPTNAPFYNFTTPTYIYTKPYVYGPRNNFPKPHKPRKPRKKVVRKPR
jgi:hypothetical protein